MLIKTQHLFSVAKYTKAAFNHISNDFMLKCLSMKIFHRSISCTDSKFTDFLNEKLTEIFKLKDDNVSNWIIENKVQDLCDYYNQSTLNKQKRIVQILATKYSIHHINGSNAIRAICSLKSSSREQMIASEKTIRSILTPAYKGLFITIGRHKHGIKFLVELRATVLQLLTEVEGNEKIEIEELDATLQELLLLWFSVGLLQLERITWQSSCDIMEKIATYDSVYVSRHWLDVKKRLNPYRRCFILTHPSMPKEPLVILHTSLSNIVPDSKKAIDVNEKRLFCGMKDTEIVSLNEYKTKITTAVFYSVITPLKGLRGIDLGNYIIKEVIKEILVEFPMIDQLVTLSPIPGFKHWLCNHIQESIDNIFTPKEHETLKCVLNTTHVPSELISQLHKTEWICNRNLIKHLKKPLMRACAWYLYMEKMKKYARNRVANFHLRNGATIWRLNWLSDTSDRGMEHSCGIMVNYRYSLDNYEENSRNYTEKHVINISDAIMELVLEAEIIRHEL